MALMQPAPTFVHLRMHTEHSIVDGIARAEAALDAAAADSQFALALTDLGNTFGFIKFYRAARARGVQPILGADVFVSNEADRASAFRALLLVKDERGYKNLCELLSMAWLTNARGDRGELLFEWFDLAHPAHGWPMHEGLICLSGGLAGEVGMKLMQATSTALEEAQAAAQKYAKTFSGRFFLEVQRVGLASEEAYNRRALKVSAELNIPLVATNAVQFVRPEDFRAHEARVCIAEGDTLSNSRRARRFTPRQYLATQAEMVERFSDMPQALANSVAIARRCSVTLSLGKVQLPQFPTPRGEPLADHLRALSAHGLLRRLETRFPDAQEREARRADYEERLALECNTIIQMGFEGYFLIVADFINWAKTHGVPVGPGRGSGAGSLVAYSLGITDLDPLPYSLLFERFLNPERVSMPDFDIDFCQEKRQQVIDYVRERWGKDAVSQIVTFGTMASRAVIRDAGRVLELPYNFCDQLSKLIPVVQNKPLSLKEAREKEPILAEREKKEDEVRELLAVAEPLEDLTRNVGMHAGGVLIAPGRLTDFCPLYQAPGSEGADGVVSMYDKDDVEAAGLVKFDFLGLKNLTAIALAVDTINRFHPNRNLSLGDLNSFDDPAAYEVLRQANTVGIFQVESQGMRRYLLKLQPDRFEDIIAMLALYRPGPLNSGMVDTFILRKRGQQKIDYFHESLRECLSATYGVIVYQEQVMQIAQIIAGYSLGGADLLRRAMGKKKPEEMAQQRSIFLEGAKKRGHSERLATDLFNLMEEFAEYGFNKSHSAAYAVLTYQTSWLKAHFPAEFLSATMSVDMDDTDKVAFLVADAKANGLRVLAPDINASSYRFEPVLETTEERARAIRYGLGAIRGLGEGAIMSILKAREGAPFKDLFDFCGRVDRRLVNKRAMEALVKAGAFDSIAPAGQMDRSRLLAGIELAVRKADDSSSNANQAGLFSFGEEEGGQHAPEVELPQVVPFSARECLLHEKVALGYCFSGSLFDDIASEMRRFAPTPLARAMPSKEPIWIAGVVGASRGQMTKRGMMRVIELDDGSAKLDVTVFNELYDARKNVLKVDEPLLVNARIENDEFSGGLRGAALEILTLTEARQRYARGVRIRVEAGKTQEAQVVTALREILVRVREQSSSRETQKSVVLLEARQGQQVCELKLPESFWVTPSDEVLGHLRGIVGERAVEVEYG